MQVCCGSAEAGVLLTFLDLPHNSTFQRNIFSRVQLAIRPGIKNVTDKCMTESRNEEVRATVGEEKCLQWKNKTIEEKEIPFTVSYDMGWNKRASGKI